MPRKTKGDIYDDYYGEEEDDGYDIGQADQDYQDYIYNLYQSGALVPDPEDVDDDEDTDDDTDDDDDEPEDDL